MSGSFNPRDSRLGLFPIMSSAAPKRPTKAAHRYWRGKPDASTSKAAGAGESDEDSELSSDDQGDARGLGRKKLQSEAERAQRQGIQIVQGDLTAETSARPSAQRHAAAPAKVEEVSTGEEEVDGSSEESSSEEEESSEGDEPAKPMFKPVFVSKSVAFQYNFIIIIEF